MGWRGRASRHCIRRLHGSDLGSKDRRRAPAAAGRLRLLAQGPHRLEQLREGLHRACAYGIWKRASPRTLQGHMDYWITRLAFSADGKKLCTASWDFTLKVRSGACSTRSRGTWAPQSPAPSRPPTARRSLPDRSILWSTAGWSCHRPMTTRSRSGCCGGLEITTLQGHSGTVRNVRSLLAAEQQSGHGGRSQGVGRARSEGAGHAINGLMRVDDGRQVVVSASAISLSACGTANPTHSLSTSRTCTPRSTGQICRRQDLRASLSTA